MFETGERVTGKQILTHREKLSNNYGCIKMESLLDYTRLSSLCMLMYWLDDIIKSNSCIVKEFRLCKFQHSFYLKIL